MSTVVVPVLLEQNFALGDGSTGGGCPVSQALQFSLEEVANLYCIRPGEFKLCFQEHGVAYNETEATGMLAEASIALQHGNSGLSYKVDASPVQMWGINFAGRVLVRHESGEERAIYLPGTRTYDPAGMTGMCTHV